MEEIASQIIKDIKEKRNNPKVPKNYNIEANLDVIEASGQTLIEMEVQSEIIAYFIISLEKNSDSINEEYYFY